MLQHLHAATNSHQRPVMLTRLTEQRAFDGQPALLRVQIAAASEHQRVDLQLLHKCDRLSRRVEVWNRYRKRTR